VIPKSTVHLLTLAFTITNQKSNSQPYRTLHIPSTAPMLCMLFVLIFIVFMYYFTCISFAIRPSGRKSAIKLIDWLIDWLIEDTTADFNDRWRTQRLCLLTPSDCTTWGSELSEETWASQDTLYILSGVAAEMLRLLPDADASVTVIRETHPQIHPTSSLRHSHKNFMIKHFELSRLQTDTHPHTHRQTLLKTVPPRYVVAARVVISK